MSKKREEPKEAKTQKKPRKPGLPRRSKTVKMLKGLNNNKKLQKCPKSHICKRHQKTEKIPIKTKLAMMLKKIRKPKRHKTKTIKNAKKCQ